MKVLRRFFGHKWRDFIKTRPTTLVKSQYCVRCSAMRGVKVPGSVVRINVPKEGWLICGRKRS